MDASKIILGVVAATLFASCEVQSPPTVSSKLIVNAVIHDGSGNAPVDGAVRFDTSTGRIIAIGDLDGIAGEVVVDAEGLVLAPGFIDPHSHHDEDYDAFRHMPGPLSQGVTTIVRGIDGGSAFPSVDAFNREFAAAPAAVNIASLSPHNTIRTSVMGDDYQRPATSREIESMEDLVDADMAAGAIGMSTGLEYEPGIYSDTEELIRLASVAARYGGMYHSHIRDEDDKIFEAVDELIHVGKEAGIAVHFTHAKLADRFFWGMTSELLGKLEAGRLAGIEVTADIYPYERWAANLAVLFPERDYTDRAAAEIALERAAVAEDILIVGYPANPDFEGQTVEQIAENTGRDVVTTLLELSRDADIHRRESGNDSSIIARSMTKDDVTALLRWPYMSVGSDGAHGGHPRGYGAFTRVLGRLVREEGVLTLPEAIYKMSGLTADTLGIADRGRIAVGNFADLVLFDPDSVVDNATMQDPMSISTGVEQVWVNGQLAYKLGKTTDTFAGQIVKRPD